MCPLQGTRKLLVSRSVCPSGVGVLIVRGCKGLCVAAVAPSGDGACAVTAGAQNDLFTFKLPILSCFVRGQDLSTPKPSKISPYLSLAPWAEGSVECSTSACCIWTIISRGLQAMRVLQTDLCC